MIYVTLSILSATGLFVLFKLFKIRNINTLQAIVVNYIAAGLCGVFLNQAPTNISSLVTNNWFWASIVLGFLFISMFYVMALTAQKHGLSVVSIASKMSLIIPILFGVLALNESLGKLKITGISFALIAVYLTAIKKDEKRKGLKSITLPVLLFLGSGVIDTMANYFAPSTKIPLFTACIFTFAFLFGCIVLIYERVTNKKQFQFKSIPFGLTLGVINYASMYYLLKALRVENIESSIVFTINNVAIVATSTLIGLLLFKEKIEKRNWIGIGIALIAIVMVSLSYNV